MAVVLLVELSAKAPGVHHTEESKYCPTVSQGAIDFINKVEYTEKCFTNAD